MAFFSCMTQRLDQLMSSQMVGLLLLKKGRCLWIKHTDMCKAMALASQHETRCAASQTTEEKWGDFANVEKMKDRITKADLDLEFIEKDEPVDWSDDADGRMFTLVFKKVKVPKRKSLEWLIQKADDFKQAGNSGSFGELWPVEG